VSRITAIAKDMFKYVKENARWMIRLG
jgi:hypothetical protein